MDLGPDDRLAIPVPFYHCFGMVLGNLAAVSAGATMVFPGEAFDPLDTLEALAAERCTACMACPRCSPPWSIIPALPSST
jgi:fatty-acyl-CoA synthase